MFWSRAQASALIGGRAPSEPSLSSLIGNIQNRFVAATKKRIVTQDHAFNIEEGTVEGQGDANPDAVSVRGWVITGRSPDDAVALIMLAKPQLSKES